MGTAVATAETQQNGGFGSASIDTEVFISSKSLGLDRTTVLLFECNGPMPHPYVLDNVANNGGSIGLTMKWLEPGHLQVTYRGNPKVLTQMVRLAGIEITLKKDDAGS